jgi:hypothetical protein
MPINTNMNPAVPPENAPKLSLLQVRMTARPPPMSAEMQLGSARVLNPEKIKVAAPTVPSIRQIILLFHFSQAMYFDNSK